MDNIDKTNAREPYEAPTIEDVPLRAEEQVLAGCKVSGQSGPGAFICGDVGTCMNLGSS